MKSKIFKVLFIEDEIALGEIIRETLELRGFQVVHHFSVRDGLTAYYTHKPDLILLDISLPDGDGYTFSRLVRQTALDTPIIFLTSRSLPQDVVTGFEQGGNDYVKKPFSIEELVIRMKALLSDKRTLLSQGVDDHQIVPIGSYQFNYLQAHLQRADKQRKLTSREAELLRILLVNRNQVLERKTILLQIWGNDDFFSGRSLDVFITKLRKYLKEDPAVQIMNIRGVGYKLLF